MKVFTWSFQDQLTYFLDFFMAYKNRPFHGVVDNNSFLISVCVSCFSDPVLETRVIVNKSFSKFIKSVDVSLVFSVERFYIKYSIWSWISISVI